MKVSEIFKIVNDCDRLRDILCKGEHKLTDIVNDCDRLRDILCKGEHKLTDSEINEICDLLWDYRTELLKKEVK